jgi:hypothetical protein
MVYSNHGKQATMLKEEQSTERLSYTVEEFCALSGISRSGYFKFREAGIGPREMRVGRRVLISKEAAAEWRQAREVSTEAA